MDWYLAIAASRRDSYPVQIGRHFDATTVAVLSSTDQARVRWMGFLKPAPPEEIGTVVEQQMNYQRWSAGRQQPKNVQG